MSSEIVSQGVFPSVCFKVYFKFALKKKPEWKWPNFPNFAKKFLCLGEVEKLLVNATKIYQIKDEVQSWAVIAQATAGSLHRL